MRTLLQTDSTADCFWLFYGGCLVFLMQAGFALLEAGSIRSKNVKNILLKNTLDACLGAVLWWACGYRFAFGAVGSDPNNFIGGKDFFSALEKPDDTTYYAGWFFQWTFAAAAATIVSGAVAERCSLIGYACYTCLITRENVNEEIKAVVVSNAAGYVQLLEGSSLVFFCEVFIDFR